MVLRLNLMKNENLVFQCLLKKLDLNPNVIDYQIRFFFFFGIRCEFWMGWFEI